MEGYGDAVRAPVRAVLRDGGVVTVCEGRRGDEPRLRSFLEGLCLGARRMRFFTAAVDLDRIAGSLTASAPDRISLIARDRDGRIVGHALCVEIAAGRAEVAVEVDDRMHGRGLGTILIAQLAEAAEARGIGSFLATVLPDNGAMLDVFRDGFDARVQALDSEDLVEFPTSAWRAARARYGEEGVARAAQRSPSSSPRSSA